MGRKKIIKQVIIIHVVNALIRVCTKNDENIDQAAINSSQGSQEDFTKKVTFELGLRPESDMMKVF